MEAGLTLSSRTTTTVSLPLRSWRPEFLGLVRENGKLNHLFGASSGLVMVMVMVMGLVRENGKFNYLFSASSGLVMVMVMVW